MQGKVYLCRLNYLDIRYITSTNLKHFYKHSQMKIITHAGLILLFCLVLKTGANAQNKIDETNLITRLSGLNNLTADEAGKYFTDQGYTLLSKQSIPQATYTMDLYKYKLKNSYLLTVITGSVAGSGIITYNEDDYTQALKIIKDMGFTPGEATSPESGKTLFAKGDLRFIIQKKTTGDKTFYVMMLNDLLKIAKLAGLKK
jgi:hypothetical protein